MQVLQTADRVPLLHEAEPGGKELAEYICSMAEQQDATPAEAWAALTCLEYATADANRVCAWLPYSQSVRPLAMDLFT